MTFALGIETLIVTMQHKKKRHKITELVIKESAAVHSVIPNDNGTFSLINSDGQTIQHTQHDDVGYLRDSGKPKILRSLTRSSGDHAGENPWKKYDAIGFIDTNSINENDHVLYVCSPSLLLWQDNSRRMANIYHVDLLVGYCAIGINPERIGWQDFMQRLLKSDVLRKKDKVLLVVDSDKSSIDAINSGKEAIFRGYRLPFNFTLAYATSDAGSESWINKEMKRRNQVASKAINKIRDDHGFLLIVRASGRLYIKNAFEEDA